MEIGSPPVHLVAIMIAYFLFVFISERLNPFVKPKSYAGSIGRWRFARIVAAAFLLFTWLGLFASELLQISKVITLGVSTLLFGVFWAIKGAKRIVKRNKFLAMSEEMRFRFARSDSSNKVLHAPVTTPNTAIQPNNKSPICSVEQRSVNVNYIDENTSEVDDSSDVPDTLSKITENKKNSLNNELFREEYQYISASRDSLVNEVASLKVSLEKSLAAERKSETIRDHALLLKDKALGIAAMERKKRRISEVKVSKVAMKIRRDKELLTVSHDRQEIPNSVTILNKPKAAS